MRNPTTAIARLPLSYQRACAALARCDHVDECKRWGDQAAALASYARQAKDDALETLARRIRARALRRAGELLQQFNKGDGRPRKNASGAEGVSQRRAAALAGFSERQELTAIRLANMPAQAFEAAVERDRPATITELARPRLAVHFSSATGEHYTPPEFLAHVQAVFGDVPDLDPCSNDKQRPNVPARAHYTAADDGLQQPWFGRVFLNPPYGDGIDRWIAKLRAEWRRGDVSELIALLPARTDTQWFDTLTSDVDDFAVCFLQGRLTFVGQRDPAPFPSMAVYFGPHLLTFMEVFRPRGSLWARPPLDYFVNQDDADPQAEREDR